MALQAPLIYGWIYPVDQIPQVMQYVSSFTHFFNRITNLLDTLQEPTDTFELAEQVKKDALFLYNLSCCVDCNPFRTDCALLDV